MMWWIKRHKSMIIAVAEKGRNDMTLAQAYEVKKLLDMRETLIKELRDIEECKSITGHINDGTNGLGFGWGNGTRMHKHLVNGVREDLKCIEEKIANFPIEEEVIDKFAEEIKLEFYREFDEIIPSIMADKIDQLKKKFVTDTNDGRKYTGSEDKQ